MKDDIFECAWCSAPSMYHHEKPSTCTSCGHFTGLLEYDNKVLSMGLVRPWMTIKDRNEFPHVYTWPARWKFYCTVPSSDINHFMKKIVVLNDDDIYKSPCEIINMEIDTNDELTYTIHVSVPFGKQPFEMARVMWKNPPVWCRFD